MIAASPRPWTLKSILREIARRKEVSIHLVPLPWKPAWLALKTMEMLGAQLNFRSDSLLSLAVPNPDINREELRPAAPRFREFGDGL